MITQTKILKAFIEEKQGFTIRKLSQKINSDYKITHVTVQSLIKKNIIQIRTIGKSTLCNLNEDYFGHEIFIAEEERKNDLNKDIKQITKDILGSLNTSFFVLLLFGSFAQKKFGKNSDIDLMFITNEKSFENQIEKIVSLLPFKINYLIFKEDDFIRMKNTLKPNVVKEAIKSNIILFNIEGYYRMKNA